MTLITGLFGMNYAHIPFKHDYHAFVATVGIMLAISVVMLSFFRLKRWI
ncbi:MAG: CorA family divalent cation transporter [Gaiellales bacterium]